MTNSKSLSWVLFTLLAIIWGSTFMLIENGLIVFTPLQSALIRIATAGIVLFPFALKTFGQVRRNQWFYVVLSGFIGSLLPAFLFAKAQTVLSGGTAGILSALTPVFVVLVSTIFFKVTYRGTQFLGLAIGFCSAITLVLVKEGSFRADRLEGLYILLATLCYAVNLNFIKYKLRDLNSKTIAFCSLLLTTPITILLLVNTNLSATYTHSQFIFSLSSLIILGATSTAIALVLFNWLVKLASPMFASSVTYVIPVVAITIGSFAGEQVTLEMLLGMLGIFLGLWLISRKN